MALTVGTDSYITVADAETYFNTRLFADVWGLSDAVTKEKALKMATRKIDMQSLIGRKADLSQTLQFPRSVYCDTDSRWLMFSGATTYYGGETFNPLNNKFFRRLPGWITESGVSQDVKDAVCEEALTILTGAQQANTRAQLQRQGVKSFSLGGLSETFSASSTPYRLLSLEASQLLARYIGGSRVIV